MPVLQAKELKPHTATDTTSSKLSGVLNGAVGKRKVAGPHPAAPPLCSLCPPARCHTVLPALLTNPAVRSLPSLLQPPTCSMKSTERCSRC